MGSAILGTSVLVFDTETTGLDVEKDRVVEFGCAAISTQEVVYGHTHAYVNPGIPIPAEATAIHGITDEKVANALTFAAQAQNFRAYLSSVPILAGYNAASYDAPLLNAEFARATLSYRLDPARVLDPIIFVRHALRHRRQRKLTEICEFFGVTLSNAHSALSDAYATAQLLLAMVRSGFIPNDLDEALALQGQYMARQAQEFERWSFWLYECRENPGLVRVGAGKHCGKPLTQLDEGFIEWLLRQTDLHPGARAAFETELARRAGHVVEKVHALADVPLKLFFEPSADLEQERDW